MPQKTRYLKAAALPIEQQGGSSMTETLKERVFRALDTAATNGYQMARVPTDEVALDLISCEADLETEDPEEIYPFVREWQEAHQK